MKTFFALLIIITVPAAAQVAYYKGEWTKVNSEENFSAFLKLELKDTVATGEIIWTFIAVDSNDAALLKYYKGLKGKMGIEYVKGMYAASTHDIHVEGISKEDPDLVIGLDKYLLKLSLDKNVIYGRSLANGANNGLVYFYKVGNATGAKQFNLSKAKVMGKKGVM